MRFPEFLEEKDSIGFVAPSFGCAIEPYRTAFDHAVTKFQSCGYGIKKGPNCYESSGIGISNTPEKCGEEFNTMYCDEDTKVLMSCGGGELMCEILNHIDFEAIKGAKAKWFIGYSDNTNLTFLLSTLADTAAIYGPCAAAFGMEPWHPAIEDAWGLLQGKVKTVRNYEKWEWESKKDAEHPLEPYHVTETFQMKCVPDTDRISFSGRLLGGCMDCLSILCGTRFDKVKDFNERYKEDGVIWFLESCELNVMDIRRVLWKMREAGWFECAKGFLIGRPMRYEEPMMGLDRHSTVTGILGEIGVPIIMDLDIGHLAPMMPIVSGSMGTVTAGGNKFSLTMEMR